MKLSDAFESPVEEGQFEWTATMLNINHGKNQELMEHCQVLNEYSLFIDKCKSFVKDCVSVLEGINKAVDACINDNVLKEFLVAHRGEVLEVLLTEFDEEKYAKAMKKEAWEDGHESGLREERYKNVKSMIEMLIEEDVDLECAIVKISKKMDLSTEDVRRIWEKNTGNN